ncbi:hypothetical protein OCU04_011866 [Sclerotinia nivalis]|uniref:F-box domain-containing protein n=1 Tax=Sclerotinia nivalis TaxID=352851 RepID=A0A9X0A9Z1_9HELO|nr:hypothetical protein OCU04_011866 [Sclerotinia nivalis]
MIYKYFEKPFRKNYLPTTYHIKRLSIMTDMAEMKHNTKDFPCSMLEHQDSVENSKSILTKSGFELNASEQQVSLSVIRERTQTSINTIPPEIVEQIMRELEPCMRACLGVTCREMYKHFKYVNPKIVNLYDRDGPEWEAKSLSLLLEDWMGPRYRLGNMALYRYLLITAYGPYKTSPREYQLAENYSDYKRSLRGVRISNTTVGHNVYVFRKKLPNPCNKGDRWEKEAIAVIDEDLLEQISIRDWTYYWRDYCIWKKHETYFDRIVALRRVREVFSHGYYMEWIEMIGF